MLKVAILGSGLSAAFCSYACFEMGFRPTIYALHRVTPPVGCVFVRKPSPTIISKYLETTNIVFEATPGTTSF